MFIFRIIFPIPVIAKYLLKIFWCIFQKFISNFKHTLQSRYTFYLFYDKRGKVIKKKSLRFGLPSIYQCPVHKGVHRKYYLIFHVYILLFCIFHDKLEIAFFTTTYYVFLINYTQGVPYHCMSVGTIPIEMPAHVWRIPSVPM